MRKFLAVAVLAGVVALGGCTQQAPNPDPRPMESSVTLTSVTHTQSKPVPDFDSSKQVETNADRLDELRTLTKDPGWDAVGGSDDGCTGGTTTHLELEWTDGTTEAWDAYACDGESELVTEVTELIASWR